ncbi:DUF262 domain-containing protein [Candidatus Halobeggiatoa sp. HSG11]|nr:DUF262 domain-containing protein [Candidatus Halobeggiatoa sp. HSG11]
MKAKEKKFLHFLEGSDKHFVIPVYQRNYDWKKEQCKQLFDDLLDIGNSDRTHFLGSIVSIYHDDGDDREYLIIDGQQRLTTLSLLLLAIYKLIDQDIVQSSVNKTQIIDEYLINKYSEDDKKIRLKPVKNDKNAFSALFKDENSYLQETNITLNYQYFYDRITNDEISVDNLFYAVKQLVIVEIELKNGEDDPQLIFESLNSTGLDLTEADKVRNFILMKESPTVQEQFYIDFWNKIEINTNYNVSNFIRDYLTIKERIIPNKNKVYIHFKRYVLENVTDTKLLLIDLLKFSSFYKKIINSKEQNDKISIVVNKINRLESIVTYPFIMEVFNDHKDSIISEGDVVSILEIIVTFVFRRLICEVPTNSLNKIFMTMGREIKKHNDYEDNYVDIFKYILTHKRLSQRMPENDEFGSKIVKKDVYNFKSKNKLFLLEQLENFNNKERVDIESLIDNNDLSIEHIMPQTLTSKWRESLGVNFAEIHEEYLNTLGNITLTGYNSSMSNKPFLEKRNMEKGFKESRLYLNKSLCEVEHWDEDTIVSRAKSLENRALKVWGYPISNYESADEILKLFTLDDDNKSFTGEKIISFKFMEEKEKKVNSWKELYKKVCLILYELDPIKFKQITTDYTFTYNGDILKDSIKIDNFQIYSNLNIESFLSRLRIIVKEMELELDDLSFIIK